MTETSLAGLPLELSDRLNDLPIVIYSSQRVGWIDRAMHGLAKKFGMESNVDYVAVPGNVPPDTLGFIALGPGHRPSGYYENIAQGD